MVWPEIYENRIQVFPRLKLMVFRNRRCGAETGQSCRLLSAYYAAGLHNEHLYLV